MDLNKYLQEIESITDEYNLNQLDSSSVEDDDITVKQYQKIHEAIRKRKIKLGIKLYNGTR